jgi:hypothetical protein
MEKSMGFPETARLTMKKALTVLLAAGIILALFGGAGAQTPVPSPADKPARGTIFFISDTDLYCSFFIMNETPALKITGGDGARTLFSDGDRVSFNAGQLMTVLEIGPDVAGLGRKPSPGRLAFQRGRVRILSVEPCLGSARVEIACGPLMTGHVLVPFIEKAKVQVKDMGLDVRARGGDALSGRVLFLEDNAVQIATNQRALIDLGRDDGIEDGRQLTVFSQAAPDQPLEASANAVVIDAGRASATVKILTAKVPVHIGDLVQIK